VAHEPTAHETVAWSLFSNGPTSRPSADERTISIFIRISEYTGRIFVVSTFPFGSKTVRWHRHTGDQMHRRSQSTFHVPPSAPQEGLDNTCGLCKRNHSRREEYLKIYADGGGCTAILSCHESGQSSPTSHRRTDNRTSSSPSVMI
jgi:hypothetical protein